MSLESTLLTNPVVAGLVIPAASTLATTGWKVLASRNNPSPNDWAVGFDLFLAAVALQLVYLATYFQASNLGTDAFLPRHWLIHLGSCIVAAISGSCLLMAIIVRSIEELWNYDTIPTGEYDRRGNKIFTIIWTLRWKTAFAISLVGGATLVFVYTINTYAVFFYVHAPQIIRSI